MLNRQLQNAFEDPNEIRSWVELSRFIERLTKIGTDARSFVRLVQDSTYDPKKKRFEFQTCHPQLTEPRMRNLRDSVGISFERVDEETCYTNSYYWTIRDKFGEKFREAVIKLKKSNDPYRIKGD